MEKMAELLIWCPANVGLPYSYYMGVLAVNTDIGKAISPQTMQTAEFSSLSTL